MSQLLDGWIGVDLDGTLAFYDGWKGVDQIGAPIPLMVHRVKQWLAEGKQVKIFTARVCRNDPVVVAYIERWCRKHLGQTLPVTCTKDFAMIEFWDDRAIAVKCNTGEVSDQKRRR